jgi:hypothetical protein
VTASFFITAFFFSISYYTPHDLANTQSRQEKTLSDSFVTALFSSISYFTPHDLANTHSITSLRGRVRVRCDSGGWISLRRR